jgi:NhaP-type Na+/H+ or K+/H+ antiporter
MLKFLQKIIESGEFVMFVFPKGSHDEPRVLSAAPTYKNLKKVALGGALIGACAGAVCGVALVILLERSSPSRNHLANCSIVALFALGDALLSSIVAVVSACLFSMYGSTASESGVRVR